MKKMLFLIIVISFNYSFSQKKIPTSTLKTLEGVTTNLQKLSQKNDLIIVSLWTTWCAPCKNELDAINDVYQDWQDETKVKFYAISVDDSRTVKRVRPLVNGKGWEFDVLLDTNNELKRSLGTAIIPLTLVISKGKIVYKSTGYTSGAEDDIYKVIKEKSKS